MKYFKFLCYRGHCGKGHSSEIVFAIEAPDFVTAMQKARKMPSVQHTKMPLSGKEITEAEYKEYRKKSAYLRYQQGRRR